MLYNVYNKVGNKIINNILKILSATHVCDNVSLVWTLLLVITDVIVINFFFPLRIFTVKY